MTIDQRLSPVDDHYRTW